MKKRSITLLSLTSLLIVSCLNCVHTFTGRLSDKDGKSISDALIYIEAYTNRTCDFLWSISGDSGEIPSKDYPKLRVLLQPGAKFTYCVLAPGKVPFVVNDRGRVFKKGDVSFIIEDDSLKSKCNPLLFHLEFPFEDNVHLRNKLLSPSQKILIERFSQSYKNAQDRSNDFSPQAYRKIESLDSLIAGLEKDKDPNAKNSYQ